MAEVVPILCIRCRGEVGTLTDGPGIRLEVFPVEDTKPGDSCAVCGCGERTCWRVLMAAA